MDTGWECCVEDTTLRCISLLQSNIWTSYTNVNVSLVTLLPNLALLVMSSKKELNPNP